MFLSFCSFMKWGQEILIPLFTPHSLSPGSHCVLHPGGASGTAPFVLALVAVSGEQRCRHVCVISVVTVKKGKHGPWPNGTQKSSLVLESWRRLPGEGLFELSHEDKQVITRDWDITQIPGLGKSVCENSARRREWRMLFTTRRCGDIKKENAIDRAL